MMMLWHLVAGHGDITVCRMVPAPEGKGMASAPWFPAGQGPAFGRADSARSGSGSTRTVPPVGSRSHGTEVEAVRTARLEVENCASSCPQPLPIPRGLL